MADIVSTERRSRMMSGIRSKNTQPEILVRKALFSAGYRFRLHRRDLPGNPDIVLPRRRVAIFVHGCFWHGHEKCSLAKVPSTRADFWQRKFEANRKRDRNSVEKLVFAGWRVLVVWECFIRHQNREGQMISALKQWIESSAICGELLASDKK